MASALAAHELAHLLVGPPARPTGAHALAAGAAGSAANAVLALLAWFVFRRGVGAPSTWSLVAWLLFAVNAWLPTTYLVVSPIFDFGDAATVADLFANRGPLRASLAATGLFVAGLLWKGTVESLARLVGNGSSESRVDRARRIVRAAAVSGGVAALAAALASPLPTLWVFPVAAAVAFGAAGPLQRAPRRVGEQPVPGAPLVAGRSLPLLVFSLAAVATFLTLLGPLLRFE